MIKSLLSNIPSLRGDAKEVSEADAKAERIKFHRDRVRNGPVKFTTVTNGQVRRAQRRAAKTAQRKQAKRTVRAYFGQTQEAAVLRGKLQAAGLQPYATGITPTDEQRSRALGWILNRFGVKEELTGHPVLTEDALQDAVDEAMHHYATLLGRA